GQFETSEMVDVVEVSTASRRSRRPPTARRERQTIPPGLVSGPQRRGPQSPGKQALLHYYSQVRRDPSRPISRSSRPLGIGLFFRSSRTKRRETHRNQPLASAL